MHWPCWLKKVSWSLKLIWFMNLVLTILSSPGCSTLCHYLHVGSDCFHFQVANMSLPLNFKWRKNVHSGPLCSLNQHTFYLQCVKYTMNVLLVAYEERSGELSRFWIQDHGLEHEYKTSSLFTSLIALYYYACSS